MCGLTREQKILPLAEAQFQKELDAAEERRGAVMLAIGYIKENSNDRSFVNRLFKRATDSNPLLPEYGLVQERQPWPSPELALKRTMTC